MITVADAVAALNAAYPPDTAQSWDAVGLVCGDPGDEVRTVLFAVDPVQAVAEQAVALRADLLVVHHPLLLRGVHSVAADTLKGRIIHTLLRAGVALYVAHTNADAAQGGVNDALAEVIGLQDLRPLEAAGASPRCTLVTYVPAESADAVIDAASVAGAGVLGQYRRCAWTGSGIGTFEASASARPSVGAAGERSSVDEVKIEMDVASSAADRVRSAVRTAHPYEEAPIHFTTQLGQPATTGIGRVGSLPAPITLRALAQRLADGLPATAHGVRASGDPEELVRTVALCSGAGDSLFAAARASEADVYVTADLRHHPASEAREHRRDARPSLLDLSHFASEWPWLAKAADVLRARDDSLKLVVSELNTDPWSFHVASRPAPGTTARTTEGAAL